MSLGNSMRSLDSVPVGTPDLRERILVKAAACFNHWRQDCWYGSGQRYVVRVPPDPRYPDAKRYAVELRSSEMNLHYPEGSLVICTPLDAVEDSIEVDQPYLIENRRRREGAQEIELSIKTLIAESGSRPRFVTESSDPNCQISHPIFGTGDEKIRPIALVTGFLQPE